MFTGESGTDQLAEIINVLGTPTQEQIFKMNPEYKDKRLFPSVNPVPWDKVFADEVHPVVLDLISKMLLFVPSERIHPLVVCAHPMFDELRSSAERLPPLFNFTQEEIQQATAMNLYEKLLPKVKESSLN